MNKFRQQLDLWVCVPDAGTEECSNNETLRTAGLTLVMMALGVVGQGDHPFCRYLDYE
jgi:hypothetical protein